MMYESYMWHWLAGGNGATGSDDFEKLLQMKHYKCNNCTCVRESLFIDAAPRAKGGNSTLIGSLYHA